MERQKYAAHIGISYFSKFHSPLWGMVDYFARVEAKNLGMKLTTKMASNNLSLQINHINELIEQKVDAILIAANASDDPDLITLIQKTLHMGIPVIAMDSAIGQESYTSIVSADNIRCQQAVATYIFEKMGGRGRVGYIQGIAKLRSSELRTKGFYNALAQFPDIELAFETHGEYHRNRTFEVMSEYLKTNPADFDAVIGANDSTAKGVYDALQVAGITKPILLSGFDAHYRALSAMFQGEMHATVKYDPQQMALMSIHTVINVLNGNTVPKQQFMPIQLVTQENFAREIISSLEALPSFVANLTVTNEQLQQEAQEREQAQVELKAYAQELERSNQELENFAYIASHDLREPLRKIQIFGDRLQKKYSHLLDNRGLDYLARMQSSSARMQAFIEDLLAYSRLSRNVNTFQTIDLTETMQDIREDIKYQIQESGAKISYNELPILEANPTQMGQLFQNLLSNAIKFQPPNATPIITITSQCRTDHFVEIRVSDNGIGFDPEHAERIFGMFQRLHGRSAYEGTGIGLAICRKIVEQHQGTITAVSQPNRGTTFIITLPTTQNHRAKPPP